MEMVSEVEDQLEGIRVKVDDRTEMTPGFKFNDWELRGVPLRIEIGPKDVENKSVMTARRDIPGREGKSPLSIENLSTEIPVMLDAIHDNMLAKAEIFRKDHTFAPANYDEFKDLVRDGWVSAFWCGSEDCEQKIKEETKATIRCIPLDQEEGSGSCVFCGDDSKQKALFARAY
jgi:prolyl-tRNA synthetase